MRKLLFSLGSPFARAVRIFLAELQLEYDKQVLMTALPIDEMASMTPTLQVPTLWDGGIVLWESTTIIEYLLSTYGTAKGSSFDLTPATYRPQFEWQDRLVLSTIQTFGTAATTISQMTWTGVTVTTNAHLDRSAKRLTFILGWLENQLVDAKSGFQGNCVSIQDIFLASHVRFVAARPIGIDLHLPNYPKISALLDRLDERESFKAVPIWFWQPGVIAYEDDGTPIYK
jgi:glutathione S-transferase